MIERAVIPDEVSAALAPESPAPLVSLALAPAGRLAAFIRAEREAAVRAGEGWLTLAEAGLLVTPAVARAGGGAAGDGERGGEPGHDVVCVGVEQHQHRA